MPYSNSNSNVQTIATFKISHQVTLTISILVSLIFFLSVLIETIPSTSLAMPLLGKYLAFTMILITVSVCATVCVLNIHFRTPSTHSMPSWVKRWCIEILPKYIFMTVPQCQSQQANTTILPEQLIYPHNLAYVAEQQHQSLFTNAITTTPTNAASAHRTFEISSENQTGKSRPPSNAGNQLNQHLPTDYRQLNPADLADWTTGKPNASPSSLFLPYLQSEAARRLQLQRSRSSERDSSSNNNSNNNNNNHNQNNNNNNAHCDSRLEQQEWTRQTVIAVDMQQEDQERKRLALADKCSKIAPHRSARKQAHKETSTGTGGLLMRIFNKGSAQKRSKPTKNARFSADVEVRLSRRQAQEKQLNQQQHQQRSSILQDSSSSIENDYQHHNHFQARASVCSTNLWRIGPTRRCSLAVPHDYPAYYRPLTHLASQHQHLHQHQQRANQIDTLSGCVQNAGHYHLARSESGSSGQQAQTVSALVNAAAHNMIVRPKQVVPTSSNPQAFVQTPQATLRAYLASGARQCATVNQNSGSPLPTPPPPLPPVGSSYSLDASRNLYQQPARHTAQLPAGFNPNTTRLISRNSQNGQLQPALILSTDLGRSPQNIDYRTASSSVRLANVNTDQQVAAQHGSSTSQYNVPHSSSYQSQMMALQQNNNNNNLNFARLQQAQPILVNMMSRSRSTDHRLCMHATEKPFYLANQQTNISDGGHLQHQSLDACSRSPHDVDGDVSINPQKQQQSYLIQANNTQSIGRALGQAYMQKLQRQPTIYSLSTSAQRPSRSIHRGTTYFVPLELSQQNQVRCSSALDSMRRSKSQTSLDRRLLNPTTQFSVTKFNHCDKNFCQNNNNNNNNSLRANNLIKQQQLQWSEHSQSCQCNPRQNCKMPVNSNRESSARDCCSLRNHQCCQQHVCEEEIKTANTSNHNYRPQPAPITQLGLMKLMNEVDKAIQNAMFIAQHIDNLDEFESVSTKLAFRY